MKKLNKALLYIGMMAVMASGVSCYAMENNPYAPGVGGEQISNIAPDLMEPLMKQLSLSKWKDSQKVIDIRDAIQANDRGKIIHIIEMLRQEDNAAIQEVLNKTIVRVPSHLDCMVFLVALGADVNAQDPMIYNYTALHNAALSNATDVVEFLLAKGANPNAKSAMRSTPLQRTVFTNAREAAEILIRYGANLDVRDELGRTLVGIAVAEHKDEMAYFFRSKGVVE